MLRILSTMGLALVLTFTVEPTRATAQDQTQQQYDVTMDEAERAMASEDWERAYLLVRQAHALLPSARTLWFLGITALGLQRPVEAIDLLQRSLSDTRRPLSSEQRARTDTLLARAHAIAAHLRIVSSTPGATATLDGVSVALGEPTLVDPGQHRVVVRAPGHIDETLTVTLDVGVTRAIEVSLRPEPQSARPEAERAATPPAEVAAMSPEPPTQAPTRATEGPRREEISIATTAPEPGDHSGVDSTLTILGWTAIGVGVAGLVTGAVAHGVGEDAIQDWNGSVRGGQCSVSNGMPAEGGVNDAECRALYDTWSDAMPVAIAGYVAGGILSATGVILLVIAPSSSPASSSSASCGPGPGEIGVSCSARF